VEFMDGGSLQDIVDAGGCDNEEALGNITVRVLHGLAFIHDRHQLHRDIKPSNLLINHFGEVKISDFGIVRELENTAACTNTFVGTLPYMSPERIAGLQYSYKSDIWSFGLSIMSCALGKFPLEISINYWELLDKLQKAPPKLPSTFSRQFQNFISQTLRRDPADRPSARDLLRHPWVAQRMINPPNDADPMPGGDTARSELEEIVAAVMKRFFEIATCKVRDGSSVDEVQLKPIERSKITRLAKQLSLDEITVHQKFENKRLEMNAILNARYCRFTSTHDPGHQLDTSSSDEEDSLLD